MKRKVERPKHRIICHKNYDVTFWSEAEGKWIRKEINDLTMAELDSMTPFDRTRARRMLHHWVLNKWVVK